MTNDTIYQSKYRKERIMLQLKIAVIVWLSTMVGVAVGMAVAAGVLQWR
jgi:hypothetical protein